MKDITMRKRVLMTILPIAIIPIILVASFSAYRLFGKLKEQGNVFYSTILTQISTNIDFIYSLNAMSFVDITKMDNFNKIINAPQFRTMNDERGFLESIGEAIGESTGNSITRVASAKFKGAFFIAETDKKSLFLNTDYLYYRLSLTDYVIDFAKLREDRFFLDVAKSPETARLNFGKPSDGILKGFEADLATMFLYPYFREGENECNKFMIVITNKDFITDVYKNIDSIKYGTLYVLDKYNNTINANHPSKDDYYEFDETKKRYMLNGDDPYVKDENMGIADYRLLNTNSAILNHPVVKDAITAISDPGYEEKSVIRTLSYSGVEYLFLAKYAQDSGVKLIYFHPLKQIYKPIYNIIFWIIIISLLVSIIIVIISYFLSYKINKPISLLTNGSYKITSGDYKTQINTEGFFGEFINLGKSFNLMAHTISEYSENLEELVKKRTEELNKAVNSLQDAYDENKRELAIAQKIQSSLIPTIFPDSDHIDFSGMYLPMEALGGDLYDVHKISETKMGILILDVCGHGVPAALITTMAKISFNSNCKKFETTNEIMLEVNNELCEAIQGSGDYLTAFYCIVDAEKRTVEFTNAAHNDIYILRCDGTIDSLEQTGPVVGVLKDVPYQSIQMQLSKGDRLVLYTDGVIEARNETSTLYDSARFIEVIKENQNKTPKEFVKFLYDDILRFKNNTPHDDDIAILIADII
ncbi:MAG: hypothetical protein A2015_08160 [Spirochaetes bacterium GWF1_31_7]|nr:MAG: hypothetical protein A2Y30_02250 [Spirochaetes bacterium GWE1_32_154]OHD47014.1 MAG: hypothetical protein A2015_08160 [Spirochaetes bacterium GWF1_31_7]OHD49791.1 MAG: hypothetical protein A2Y29_06360 [Spirochaetes bacterium GWE2_31_10]OHD83408.1 MAG: hypothetical protein A2355_04485 [Spirochaetes bacterium RIFOXYB1_FULL_32_8]HBD96263.1 hypothetical protein [Spirochaetia bacterium]